MKSEPKRKMTFFAASFLTNFYTFAGKCSKTIMFRGFTPNDIQKNLAK